MRKLIQAAKAFIVAELALVLILSVPFVALAASFGTQNFFYAPGNVITPLSGFTTSWGSGGSSYPFNASGNATSTLTQFNGGLTAYASSTVGNGTQIGGLTISGGATTTGNASISGTLSSSNRNFTVDSSGNVNMGSGGFVISYGASSTLSNGFTVWNPSTDAVGLYNSTAGYVGINNTSPVAQLDVNGNINFDQAHSLMQNEVTILTGSTTEDNLYAGLNAGAAIRAVATSSNITSGLGNAIFGDGAFLNATSSADHSTAFGSGALAGGTGVTDSGVQNTAIGNQALYSFTSGGFNTAVGYHALNLDGAGFSNVAIGLFGLADLTGGGNNVAIGNNADLQNQTGNKNVAIGTNADGGSSAGNVSHSFNTTIGFTSGSLLTSGSSNVYIGANTASTTQTGSNNICIGYDLSCPTATNNGSNTLDIGNAIYGTGITSQASSTPAGSIGIATSTFSSSGVLSIGQDGATTNATTTIITGHLQIEGENSAGTLSCAEIVGTSWVVTAGACNF